MIFSKAVTSNIYLKFRPLSFFRVVASEYLAAYQLNSGKTSFRDAGEAQRAAEDVFWSDCDGTTQARPVIDISTHPRFDASRLQIQRSAASGSPSAGDGSRTSASWPLRSA
jgi:hypothetical protein